ncbi:MAG: hypothetical protein RQ826_11400 [Xanthomonadales bacterium]|nr:hypothetical protein [Xanthomonadales bacterium]
MMKTRWIILLSGLLSLAVSGAAAAHDSAYYDGHRDGRLSGGATVWVDPYGRIVYGGSLSYRVGSGYAPGYIPWIPHKHGKSYRHTRGYQHAPAYGYYRADRKSGRHGHEVRRHGQKHGKAHYGRRH